MKMLGYVLSIMVVLTGLIVPSGTLFAAEPLNMPSGEVIIPFATFEGEEVALVYEAQFGYVGLRIPVKSIVGNDKALEYMTAKVLEIVTYDGPYPLGDTGYSIDFTNGYPHWGPTTSSIPHEGYYQSLHFGREACLCGQKITASGTPEKPPYSWYYDDHSYFTNN